MTNDSYPRNLVPLIPLLLLPLQPELLDVLPLLLFENPLLLLLFENLLQSLLLLLLLSSPFFVSLQPHFLFIFPLPLLLGSIWQRRHAVWPCRRRARGCRGAGSAAAAIASGKKRMRRQ